MNASNPTITTIEVILVATLAAVLGFGAGSNLPHQQQGARTCVEAAR